MAFTLLVALFSTAPAAWGELIFHAGFDGRLRADYARGAAEAAQAPAKAEFVDGVRGQALRLERDRLFYELADNLNLRTGTVTLWVKPLDWDPRKNTSEYDWMFIVSGEGGGKADRLMLFKRPRNVIGVAIGKGNAKERYLYQKLTKWAPNEWRFYALSWDAGVMKFFVDGREFRKTLITEDDIPKTVREVIRLQATHAFAYDELRIHDRMLTNDAIWSIYAEDRPAGAAEDEAPPQIEDPLVIDPIPLSLDEVLKVRWEVKRDIGETLDVTTRLKDADGKTLQERHERAVDRIAGELVFDMKPLDEFDYQLATTVKGETDSLELTTPFKCYKNAEWIGYARRAVDDWHFVPPPWKPIEVADDAVRTLTQEQRFGDGALPGQILSQGRPLLAAPARLTLQIDGRAIRPTRRRQWDTSHPDVVSSEQPLDGARVRLATRCEFDGMTRFDLTLEPTDKPMRLERLALEIPIRADRAKYKRLYNTWRQDWHTLDLDPSIPERYHDRFTPHVWIGDDERGLAWFTNSDEYYSLEVPDRVIEIERRGDDRVVLRVNMVDAPRLVAKPLTYTFGLMATPSKPLPDDWKRFYYTSTASNPAPDQIRYTMIYSAGREYSAKRGVAWPAIDPQRAIRAVDNAHKTPNTRVVIYTTTNAMLGSVPEFRFFEQEWKNPRMRDPSLVATYGAEYWGVNPNVASWRDFFLWTTDKAIAEYDIDGLYYDIGVVTDTFNPRVGNGYLSDGKEVATYPIFADRELRKRVYQLFAERKGEAHFIFHPMLEMTAPLSSFMDIYLDCEPYGKRMGMAGHVVSKDYTKLITLERFRATMGFQFGAVPYFLPKGATASKYDYGTDWLKKATRTMIALVSPHGVPIWGFYCDKGELNKLIRARAEFGVGTSEFTPYFRLGDELRLDPLGTPANTPASGKTNERKILVSYWKKPNDWLVIVGNLADEPYSGTLAVDRSRLLDAAKTGAALSVYDAVTKTDLPADGARISLRVEPKDYIVLRITAK